MSGIVYRIVYPGIIAALLCGLFILLTSYSSRRMKRDKQKVARYEIVFFTVLGLLGLGLSGYYSLDLILRDFSRFEGQCVMTQDAVRFVNDEGSVTLGVTSEYKEQLIPGETYSVHYGKRTKMLTDYTR